MNCNQLKINPLCLLLIMFLININLKAQKCEDTICTLNRDFDNYYKAEQFLDKYINTNEYYYLNKSKNIALINIERRKSKINDEGDWPYLLIKINLYDKNYEEALQVLDSLNKEIIPYVPYYNDLLELRIKAMQVINKDTIKYEEYLQGSILTIEEFFDSNLDIYKDAMTIGYSKYRFCIEQYYYYLNIYYGEAYVENKLKELLNKNTFDEIFINELLENNKNDLDFMMYNIY